MIINSFKDIESNLHNIQSPIILYSGGLDSSYLAAVLKSKYNLEPHCLRVDVGQTDLNDITALQELQLTEKLIDQRQTLIDEFIVKSIQNGGLYGYGHFLSSSLTRPLLAQTAVEYAKEINSNCILHCAIPSQNSSRRFNNSILALGFAGNFGSPFALEDIPRSEKVAYLKSLGIQVNPKRSFSHDTNLWCREFEAGDLDNIEGFEVPEDNFLWTKVNKEAISQKIVLGFEKGILTHVNNEHMPLIDSIAYLNKYVGQFGIGRQISLEEGPISKVVEARECPAAHIISKAFYDLFVLKYPRTLIENKMAYDQRWTTLACEGQWFSHEKIALEKQSEYLAENITGEVYFTLNHGGIILNGMKDHIFTRQNISLAS